MNWFKNLNAMPRLMSSFGVLLVLTLVISYLAISNLARPTTASIRCITWTWSARRTQINSRLM